MKISKNTMNADSLWPEMVQKVYANLCMNIYKNREFPEDFVLSVFLAIEKVHTTHKCEEHRTITLIVYMLQR